MMKKTEIAAELADVMNETHRTSGLSLPALVLSFLPLRLWLLALSLPAMRLLNASQLILASTFALAQLIRNRKYLSSVLFISSSSGGKRSGRNRSWFSHRISNISHAARHRFPFLGRGTHNIIHSRRLMPADHSRPVSATARKPPTIEFEGNAGERK